MRPLALLRGARVRRIDAPSADLFAFTLASSGYKGVLIVSLRRGAHGVGLLATRPHGQPANAFTLKLRKEIEGARVDDLARIAPHVVELRVTRTDGKKRVVFELGAEPELVLLDAEDQVLATLHARKRASPYEVGAAHGREIVWDDTLEALELIGSSLLHSAGETLLAASRDALQRGLRAAKKRLERKRVAIAAEAARVERAPKLRADATLLLANLAQVPRGASSARVLDYTQDPAAWIELALDPALDTRAQAEAWFRLAKRFDRGARISAERLVIADRECDELAQLQEALARASDERAIEALAQQARRFGVHLQESADAQPTTRSQQHKRLPYRELRGDRERPILVGRGAAANDELTLKHARPHDLWLHARDTAGAHVIVPLSRDEACPPELLRDAALLAAHFSGHRGESMVDVTYVARRYIRKPRGAAAGSVNVEREKVFRLQLDQARLAQLLASELPNT